MADKFPEPSSGRIDPKEHGHKTLDELFAEIRKDEAARKEIETGEKQEIERGGRGD